MTDYQPTADATSHDELLVAYLDGELPADEQVRIERRLADDPQFRDRLAQLQQAWDLLDLLQRSEVNDDFTRSTVAMVAVKAADDVQQRRSSVGRQRLIIWSLGAVAVTASALAGYLLLLRSLDEPNRQLVRDLPVIERVDEYRHAESVDFLRELHEQDLFGEEVDDAL